MANGERVRSCTVIAREPNEVIAELQARMPVVLTEDQWPRWLNEVPT
jgi:putative SOS response-associated peptidase YedK